MKMTYDINLIKNSLKGLTDAEKHQKITTLYNELYSEGRKAVDVQKQVTPNIKKEIDERNKINECIKLLSMMERPYEHFTDLHGIDDLCETSNFGRIRFKADHFSKTGKLLHKKGEILKPCLNNDYYLNFAIDGKHFFNHSAVIQSFLGENTNLEVDHIDRCPLNNDLANLRYVTHGENMKNANRGNRVRHKHKNHVLVQYTFDGETKAIYRGGVQHAIFQNEWGNVASDIYRAANYGCPAKGYYWRWREVAVY